MYYTHEIYETQSFLFKPFQIKIGMMDGYIYMSRMSDNPNIFYNVVNITF